MSLVSLSPSPVREDMRLTVTLSINPPAEKRIRSGILVFDSYNDSSNGSQVDELIAVAFQAGDDTDHVSYLGIL